MVRVEQKSLHAQFLQTLSDSTDFDSAVKVNLDVVSHSPKKPPSDEALFNLGLIYAHARNPKKDYKKSLGYFRRMVREFPQSLLVTEAEIWIGVLEDIARALQVDIEIEEKKKELAP